MNGAVHGDAMTTASTPEPNASSVRFFDDQPVTPDGASWPNSNTPDRLSASTKNSIASALTTAGDCSWKPQPSCSPAARSAASAAPSATNVSTTPAANATASRRIVAPRVLVRREAQHLQRQHREHAGHQIEDQAADERGHDGDGERDGIVAAASRGREIERGRGCRRGLRARARRCPAAATSIVAARARAEPAGGGDDAGDASSGPASVGATGSVSTYASPSRVDRLRARRLDPVRRRTGRSEARRDRPRPARRARASARSSCRCPRRSTLPAGERRGQRGARRGDGGAPARIGVAAVAPPAA